MAKKGGKRQIKPLAMPRSVKLSRKSTPWTSKSRAGPHQAEVSIPLRTVIKSYLSLARNTREADRIITGGSVLVDGKPRKDPKFPVGFMDVINLPEVKQSYRILLDHLGRLTLNGIPDGELTVKLCRINQKRILKGKAIQLTLHDGKTMVGQPSLKPGDVLKIALPDIKVVESFPMAPGALALVTGGKNTGKIGKIEAIRDMKGTQPNIVVLIADEKKFEAPQGYVFVVGKDSPAISIQGVGA